MTINSLILFLMTASAFVALLSYLYVTWEQSKAFKKLQYHLAIIVCLILIYFLNAKSGNAWLVLSIFGSWYYSSFLIVGFFSYVIYSFNEKNNGKLND